MERIMKIVSILFLALLAFGCRKKDNGTNPVDDSGPIITDGLVGYWPLDSNGLDFSGNNLDGVLYNTKFTENMHSESYKAAMFDSESIAEIQTVRIADQPLLDLTNTFSISSWVYVEKTYGNSSVQDYEFISKWGAGNRTESAYVHGVTGNGKFYLGTYDDRNTTVYSNIDVPLEQWVNLTSTFDNGRGMLYINGLLVGVMENMDTPTDAYTDLTFGARQNNLSTFHGKLDEVYIFDRVLDIDEIQKLARDDCENEVD